MVKIIGVRFRNVGKIYYFNPKSFQMKPGDHVIVETARGVEYGTVAVIRERSGFIRKRKKISIYRSQTGSKSSWKRMGYRFI